MVSQLPGTGTLEARVTEYRTRKAIRNIFRATSFFRGGHGANFDVEATFVEDDRMVRWEDVVRPRGHIDPNRANLKCRGIFAIAPLPWTFTCFHNLTASKGGGSAPHQMHLRIFSSPNINQNLLPNKLRNRLTLQLIADNYPPASSRSPRDPPKAIPRILRDKP
jgi:hypothetical protein